MSPFKLVVAIGNLGILATFACIAVLCIGAIGSALFYAIFSPPGLCLVGLVGTAWLMANWK